MPTTGDGPLLVNISDGVAVLTMHRPDARNALNGELRAAIPKAIAELDADPSVRVMVLTGTDPAFCAGLDLKAMGGGSPDARRPAGQPMSSPPFAPRTTTLIGAVNGPAITGGFELALNCDFLIASDRARFADTHARVGVMPGWGLTPLLADAVGVRRAREISLTGTFVTAAEALQWGLVNRVVPHDELMSRTLAIAAEIATNESQAVDRMLATYRAQEEANLADGWRIEGEAKADFGANVSYTSEELIARRDAAIERGSRQVSDRE